jgi:predicted phage baseplate assembly protein
MRDFVVEIDNRGAAHLRFGDDDYGKRPDPETVFDVAYRIGNGTRGNVGQGAICHAVSGDAGIEKVSNRLPATGGVDPESIEHVRKHAPHAFRTQERAVTPDDYASRLELRADVLRATATFRWTGSWYTVFNTVERTDEALVTEAFEAVLADYLENYRLVGRDVEVDVPRFVSLDIAADVCVKRDYFRADVLAALRALFASAPGGLFDPARFAFGQTVYLSPLYAAAQSIEGVDSIEFTKFEPRGAASRSGLAAGAIPMGRLEIARAASDPSFPERGHVEFTMRGGK